MATLPNPGDIVRYIGGRSGFMAGYFVRVVNHRDGTMSYVLDVPELGRSTTIKQSSVVAVRPRVSQEDIDL